MNIIGKVLRKLSDFLPENRVQIDGDVYLRRFYLCGKMPKVLVPLFNFGPKARQRLGFLPTIYLHCFYRPDHDRDLHNHPWAGTSLILTGGYVEERYSGNPADPNSRKKLKVVSSGDINKIHAHTYHRVDRLLEDEVWTLFVLGPKVQSWGFWSEEEGRHIHHKEYFNK